MGVQTNPIQNFHKLIEYFRTVGRNNERVWGGATKEGLKEQAQKESRQNNEKEMNASGVREKT